ncbi:GtrA family protein [Streptomyces showdoensis]|uniref:Membrane protein n=1 Tax=Streptomyces showdoensis TaxID=68268 RepID=A0A2P2GF24_STREW|nr:GtrA family protein [Streptomyces showdoensis]KKZ69385.1 membrane protein [Streptomyces showdoensis]
MSRGPARGGGRGHELLGFAVSGAAAYAADLAVFLALHGPLGPVAAKSVSFLAGCTVAYLGNALGTYRRRAVAAREYAAFFGVNLAGAAVQLLCLAVSHYGLGLTSARADTVSGLGVGMALATCLRFWGNRTLVFRAPPTEGETRTTWTG